MKMIHKILAQTLLLMFVFTNVTQAQEEKVSPRFSNKGLKFSIGSTNQEMISERHLDKGEGGSISLGYGFSDNFSMWLSAIGSEHLIEDSEVITEFGGLELNLQHKFNPDEAWQPYTKLGVGVYELHEKGSDVSLIGAGIAVGLGFDYFFSRHFGIGAEISLKKLDYISRKVETVDGEHITDIRPHLNGDTSTFMIHLVIQ